MNPLLSQRTVKKTPLLSQRTVKKTPLLSQRVVKTNPLLSQRVVKKKNPLLSQRTVKKRTRCFRSGLCKFSEENVVGTGDQLPCGTIALHCSFSSFVI